MSTSTPCMSSRSGSGLNYLQLIMLVLGTLVFVPLANADVTWGAANGPQTSGDPLLWSVGANWSGDATPTSGDTADIGDTTADRNIVTPSTPTTITQLKFSQSATATGVNKLTLGNDLNILNDPGAFNGFLNNNSSSASNLVVDLNGHNLNYTQWDWASLWGTSLQTSAPGGTLIVDSLYSGDYNGTITPTVRASVGPGVTVELLNNTDVTTYLIGTDYSTTSTLLIAPAAFSANYASDDGTTPVGNFTIGINGNASNALFSYNAAYSVTAKGNVTIYAPTGSTAQNLALAGGNLFVAGNFIDHGASNATGYGTGAIEFNGAPATPRAVSIARSLTNNFYVGNAGHLTDSIDTGNIKLTQNLTTTGAMAVTTGSMLDVGDSTLTTSTFTGYSDMTLGLTFGAHNGVADVTNLTLNAFNLDLDFDGGFGDFTQGGDLVLFNYSGSFNGTPSLTSLTVTQNGLPQFFTYGSLVNNGSEILLTDVMVPEPASLGLLAIGGLMMLRRGKRNSR